MTTTVERPAAPPAAQTVRSQRATQLRNHPLWFLAPAMVVLVVFFFLPTLFNFIYALTDWSSFKSGINFVGFANFMEVLGSGSLLNDLRITLIYGILVAIFQNLFGLVLALILEQDTRINRFARVAFFVPVVMSALAVGYIFQALLKPTGGLNEILGFVTGHPVTIAWLGNTTWTLLVVTLIHAWKWMGLSMLIYLAGLKTISPEVIEAARIDGASWWQTFRRIRFPLLAPAVTFNVATALLGSMNGFDVVQATTGGGPGGSTELLNIYIFRTFGQGLFAQATAMSLSLFIMVTIIAFPVIIILRRRERVL
ncbi:MAG: ABC-type sugar transport system, permease component [Frondihabitans sp.]|nr:ABC-type sugar transport system, permease component [Frondihabitans sp.]